jgi:hypothetical protein
MMVRGRWILEFRREEVVTLKNLVIDDDELLLNLLALRPLYDVDEMVFMRLLLMKLALRSLDEFQI